MSSEGVVKPKKFNRNVYVSNEAWEHLKHLSSFSGLPSISQYVEEIANVLYKQWEKRASVYGADSVGLKQKLLSGLISYQDYSSAVEEIKRKENMKRIETQSPSLLN